MNLTPSFVLEGISIARSAADVFKFISDRYTLPLWTKAFKKITPTGADYETPGGIVPIGLEVVSDVSTGVVDWIMKFPDGNVARAFGRVVAENAARATVQFCFAPELPPEMRGEMMAKLSSTIRAEFTVLQQTLELPR